MAISNVLSKPSKTESRREPSLWDPFNGASPFGLGLGRLLDSFWRSPFRSDAGRFLTPEMDVAEDENRFHVTVELPGMKKEDVKIELENGLLVVHGEKKEESERKGRTYHLVERRYGAFHRSFSLPPAVDADKIEAEFNDGVLEIVLPKTEASKPRELKIK